MSEPMTDDLQHAFDDLVGDPRPAANLAARARVRGTTLRRQRMAGGLAAVAVTGALCVPGLALVRDQAQGGAAGAPVAGQPTATGNANIDKARTGATASADALKKARLAAAGVSPQASDAGRTKTAVGGTTGLGPTEQTELRPGTLTGADHSRVDAAQALLPIGFTVEDTSIAVEVSSGAHVGAAVTFAAPSGGGKVGIEWSTGQHSTGSATATIGPKDGAVGPLVLGAVLVRGTTEWDLKVVQGPAGSTPILETATKASAFLDELATAPS